MDGFKHKRKHRKLMQTVLENRMCILAAIFVKPIADIRLIRIQCPLSVVSGYPPEMPLRVHCRANDAEPRAIGAEGSAWQNPD